MYTDTLAIYVPNSITGNNKKSLSSVIALVRTSGMAVIICSSSGRDFVEVITCTCRTNNRYNDDT